MIEKALTLQIAKIYQDNTNFTATLAESIGPQLEKQVSFFSHKRRYGVTDQKNKLFYSFVLGAPVGIIYDKFFTSYNKR